MYLVCDLYNVRYLVIKKIVTDVLLFFLFIYNERNIKGDWYMFHFIGDNFVKFFFFLFLKMELLYKENFAPRGSKFFSYRTEHKLDMNM